MLQKIREWLILFLLAFLPFHAFLVTSGTRLLAGAGQAPLPWLAGWKEILLTGVLVIVIVEVCFSLRVTRYALRVDVMDGLILGLFVLGAITSIIHNPLSITHFVYGFKYTLFPLLLFLLLRRVPWSERFALLVTRYSLLVGVVVAAYGILTLFLPAQFFTWLGYSDLHSTYLPDGPLAAFQYLEGMGIRRMQSTFAGPNQLGIWLLVPLSVALVSFRRIRNQELGIKNKEFLLLTSCFLLLTVALFLTFSRAAWVGAAVILLVTLWRDFSRRARYWLLASCLSFLITLLVASAITRPQSTAEHFRRPLEALRVMVQHPLGLGLGAAGPAANRTGDSCMYFEDGADVSWAADRPSLCVFVGGKQVQPLSRVCQCPLLPENWYLQVGVELGAAGLILYSIFVVYILWSLWAGNGQWARGSMCALAARRSPLAAFLPFLGISIAALFLHTWEDSAVAYTAWILIAVALPSRSFFPREMGGEGPLLAGGA